ncbi:hypothetical protein ERJ75_000594800 [Trypanosoma vivax]|nr:hypothetical protein ERJ75_000594800 [Trypanosoma vivax]
MLDVAPLCAVVLLSVAAVIVVGKVVIAGAGFLCMAFGTPVVALCLSMLVCACVVWLLEVSGGAAQELIPVALLRAVLASVAQLTVGSVALLAVLVVVFRCLADVWSGGRRSNLAGLTHSVFGCVCCRDCAVAVPRSPAPAVCSRAPVWMRQPLHCTAPCCLISTFFSRF